MNIFIRFQKAYDEDTLKLFADACEKKLNKEQLIIYKSVLDKDMSLDNTKLYFVDGPGGKNNLVIIYYNFKIFLLYKIFLGTGKTFLYNEILARKRSQGKIAIAVATSGIAANLLDGGQTAHSIFRIPLKVFKDTVCRINTNSDLATMLRECGCIIWDEAVMAHKLTFMAVERTLRDIMSINNTNLSQIPFGGKLILFGGDFRQILPVVKKGNRSQIVNASIKNSSFWKNVINYKITENMRIKSAAANQGIDSSQLNMFSEYLISIGEGKHSVLNDSKFVDEIK